MAATATTHTVDPVMLKHGEGVEIFRSRKSQMPGDGDNDYDGVQSGKIWRQREGLMGRCSVLR
ncbi:hypothetical protein H0H92_011576, partial [Tricholoma furcatifolium]